MNFKQLSLHISKRLGLFSLARLLGPPGLRILCYHGFAMDDEADFRPKLFISPETFERRLRLLTEGKFPVIGLLSDINKLTVGPLPMVATVITVDDRFYSVL